MHINALALHRVWWLKFFFLVFLIGCQWALLQAQEADSTGAINLDSVMVRAQRTPSRLDHSGRSIDIVTQAQLDALPVNSLVEALNYAAGLEIRARGPMGVQADPRMRGGRFNQVLVLLNGVRMNDPQTGHHQLNLPIDLIDVERIEIIRGPASRVYGPNAFSGAINIITKKPADSLHVDAAARYGRHNSYRLAASAEKAVGRSRHRISASRLSHEGYRPITYQQQNNLLYQGQWQDGLRLTAGWNERDFGANSFYTTRFPDQREKTGSLFGALQWQGENTWHPRVQGYVRRHEDRFALRIDPDTRQVNRHTTYAYGLESNVHRSWAGGTTAIGLDLRREDIASSNLGDHQNEQLNAYVEHAIWFGARLKTVAGALLHLNSEQRPSLHPGLDLLWKASSHWRFFGSVNQALRNPTYTERFYEDAANVGNPGLRAEKSATAELGGRYQGNGQHWQGAIFRRWGRDIIDWNRPSKDAVWQATNLAKLNFLGVEAQWQSVRPFGLEWLSQLRMNGTAMEAERAVGARESRSALSHLNYQASGLAAFRLAKPLSLSVSAWWHMPESRAAYAVANARLSYRWHSIVLEAQLENIANKRYEAYPGVVMPGRWWWTGLRYQFQ